MVHSNLTTTFNLALDRLGVRFVCVIGYAIIGLSLLVITQVHNVYPQLLLARLLFSVGGAATATMVTAILPTMTLASLDLAGTNTTRTDSGRNDYDVHIASDYTQRGSASSVDTITPAEMQPNDSFEAGSRASMKTENSIVSGLVGMCTGFGALLALSAFLPLPARYQAAGNSPARAIQNSFATVGCVAFAVSIFCGFGLRHLPGEMQNSWSTLIRGRSVENDAVSTHENPSRHQKVQHHAESSFQLGIEAIHLGLTDVAIGLGYLGGFVARASSVAISLFIPLFVNAYFISEGLCQGHGSSSDPTDIKMQCSRAYKLAAILTGVSQLIALLCAPVFGWVDGHYRKFNLPLLISASAGIIGYVIFTRLNTPELDSKRGGSPAVLLVMALIGISQIGAIVCSLSMLGRGVQSPSASFDTSHSSSDQLTEAQIGTTTANTDMLDEESSLLRPRRSTSEQLPMQGREATRNHLKGSIAGVYSLFGGAGILLLTKLGGFLFDRVSTGAPFYMLAGFNAILLLVGLICGIWRETRISRRHAINALEVCE